MTDADLKNALTKSINVLRPKVGRQFAHVCLGGSVSIFNGDTYVEPEAVAAVLNDLPRLLNEVERRL